MKSFKEHMKDCVEDNEFEDMLKKCEENNVDMAQVINIYLENCIAEETDEEKRAELIKIYSEGPLSWLGDKIGQGVQNFKQGYAQGRYGQTGDENQMQSQMSAVELAKRTLTNAGIYEPFRPQFDSILKQIQGQKIQPGQPAQVGQQQMANPTAQTGPAAPVTPQSTTGPVQPQGQYQQKQADDEWAKYHQAPASYTT